MRAAAPAIVELAAMQRGHAPLAFRIHPGEGRLRGVHRVLAQMADQLVGGGPGRRLGLAHDHVQPDAELHAASVARRALAHVGDLAGYGLGRLAPGQVHVQLLGRQLVRGSDEPPKYSGGYGFCVGGYSTLPPLDTSFSPSWL